VLPQEPLNFRYRAQSPYGPERKRTGTLDTPTRCFTKHCGLVKKLGEKSSVTPVTLEPFSRRPLTFDFRLGEAALCAVQLSIGRALPGLRTELEPQDLSS